MTQLENVLNEGEQVDEHMAERVAAALGLPIAGAGEEKDEEPDYSNPADVASAVAAITKPDEPQIRVPETGEVDLAWGVEIDGTRHRRAMVRELRGADEEAFARLDNRSDSYLVTLQDMILRRATESVGGIVLDKGNLKLLGKMLMGDRDALFMQILLATYGEEKTYERVMCTTCQAETDFTLHIPSIIERKGEAILQDDHVVVKLRDGTQVVLRFPTGEDQLAVWNDKPNANEAEQNTVMIERCLVEHHGNRREFALNLGLADRHKIVAALDKGPKITFKEVKLPCHNCETDLPLVFGWADLLFV